MKLLIVCLFFLMGWSESQTSSDVLLSVPVNVDGKELEIKLFQGQTFESAALNFVNANGLRTAQSKLEDVNRMIIQLSQSLKQRLEIVQKRQQQGPMISIPFTIDDISRPLHIYVGQSILEAVGDYLRASQLPKENQQNLIPKLVEAIETRLRQGPRVALKNHEDMEFSVVVNLDDKQYYVYHYRGGNPIEEARNFCLVYGISSEDLLNQIVPQMAEKINQRIFFSKDQARRDAIQQSGLTPILKISVTLDGREVDLFHFAEYSAKQSVLQFFKEFGITDPNKINEFGPQLIEAIRNQGSNIPVLTLPLIVNQQNVNLEYFAGDSPELTAKVFMERVGMGQDPKFQELVRDLSAAIRERMQEKKVQVPPPPSSNDPLFSVPISLNESIVQLHYHEGETPEQAGLTFCQNNWSLIQATMNGETVEAQLEECVLFLARTIMDVLVKLEEEGDELSKQKTQNETIPETQTLNPSEEQNLPTEEPEASTKEEQTPTEETKTDANSDTEKRVLFNLNISLEDGKEGILSFHDGEDPETVAKSFTELHQLSPDNIPLIVEEIHKQMKE